MTLRCWMYELRVLTPDRIEFVSTLSGRTLCKSHVPEHALHLVRSINEGVADLRARRDAGTSA